MVAGLAILAALAIGALLTGAGRQGARQYPEGSDGLTELLRSAAPAAQVPEAWAENRDLHYIVGAESGGWIGRPNYTYGQRNDEAFPRDVWKVSHADMWPQVHAELKAGVKGARSTATGIGQLILDNVKAYYPDGVAGIGDPYNEAVGFLAYVRDRYGSPRAAAEMRRTRGNY